MLVRGPADLYGCGAVTRMLVVLMLHVACLQWLQSRGWFGGGQYRGVGKVIRMLGMLFVLLWLLGGGGRESSHACHLVDRRGRDHVAGAADSSVGAQLVGIIAQADVDCSQGLRGESVWGRQQSRGLAHVGDWLGFNARHQRACWGQLHEVGSASAADSSVGAQLVGILAQARVDCSQGMRGRSVRGSQQNRGLTHVGDWLGFSAWHQKCCWGQLHVMGSEDGRENVRGWSEVGRRQVRGEGRAFQAYGAVQQVLLKRSKVPGACRPLPSFSKAASMGANVEGDFSMVEEARLGGEDVLPGAGSGAADAGSGTKTTAEEGAGKSATEAGGKQGMEVDEPKGPGEAAGMTAAGTRVPFGVGGEGATKGTDGGSGGRAATRVKFEEPKGEEPAEEQPSPTVRGSEDESPLGMPGAGGGQLGAARGRAPARLDSQKALRQKSVGRSGGKMVMEVTQEVGASQLADYLAWLVRQPNHKGNEVGVGSGGNMLVTAWMEEEGEEVERTYADKYRSMWAKVGGGPVGAGGGTGLFGGGASSGGGGAAGGGAPGGGQPSPEPSRGEVKGEEEPRRRRRGGRSRDKRRRRREEEESEVTEGEERSMSPSSDEGRAREARRRKTWGGEESSEEEGGTGVVLKDGPRVARRDDSGITETESDSDGDESEAVIEAGIRKWEREVRVSLGPDAYGVLRNLRRWPRDCFYAEFKRKGMPDEQVEAEVLRLAEDFGDGEGFREEMARAWCKIYADGTGGKRHLTKSARVRGHYVRNFLEAREFGVAIAFALFSLTTREFDVMMTEFRAGGVKDHGTLVNRVFGFLKGLKKGRVDGADGPKLWWEDHDAGQPEYTLDLGRLLNVGGGGTVPAPTGRGGGGGRGKKQGRTGMVLPYPQGPSPVDKGLAGGGATFLGAMGPGVGGHQMQSGMGPGPSSGMVAGGPWAGTPQVLGQAYLQSTGKAPGHVMGDSRGGFSFGGGYTGGCAVDRGTLNQAMYRLTNVRTRWFTEEFVRGEMDERNKERMACLPPWLQDVVARIYAPSTGRESIDEPNKRLSGVIGGIRKLHDSGLMAQEAERIGELAVHGKVSYQPCRDYGRHGTCKFGDRCRFFHIIGVHEV